MNLEREGRAVARLIDQADNAEDQADRCHWEAAERIAGMRATGTKQTEIARLIGRSEKTVRRYLVAWDREGSVPADSRGRFWEAADGGERRGREQVEQSPTARARAIERWADENPEIVAKAIASKPAVVADVVGSALTKSGSRQAVLRTTSEWAGQSETKARETQRERAPELTDTGDWYHAIAALHRARRLLGEGFGLLGGMRRIGAARREELAEEVDRLQAAVDWLRSVADGGETTMDEELHELLSGEAI